jgi:hypothetical protein
MQASSRNPDGDVVLVVILLVVVLALIAAGLIVWVVRARSCARTFETPAGVQEDLFRGGILCKNLTTSGHTVRLELFDWGVRLRGTVVARWVVPTWEARYDELAVAEVVATSFSRNAVWFRLLGEPGGMGFLSERSPDIMKALEKHKVPVNRAVTRVKRVDDLYRSSS